jgi:AcrR family transcriptional regulator
MKVRESSPEARRGGSREAIVEAAERLFLERGFGSVSMDELAEAAGMARRDPLRPVREQGRDLREMLLRVSSQLEDAFPPGIESQGNVEDVLRLVAQMILDLHRHPEYPGFLRMVVADSRQFPWIAEEFSAVTDPLAEVDAHKHRPRCGCWGAGRSFRDDRAALAPTIGDAAQLGSINLPIWACIAPAQRSRRGSELAWHSTPQPAHSAGCLPFPWPRRASSCCDRAWRGIDIDISEAVVNAEQRPSPVIGFCHLVFGQDRRNQAICFVALWLSACLGLRLALIAAGAEVPDLFAASLGHFGAEAP